MAARIHQSLEWFGDFRCLFAHVRAYAIRPYTCSLNLWPGRCICVACSLTSGRMRYAPTLVRLIVGRGGDFRCAFAHVRAYAIRPYSFWRNLWRASNNGERYFLPEFFYTSSYRYFLLAKNFGSSYRYFLMLQIALARRTGTFWCFILHRLVVPVLFDVSNCIGSSYR